MVKMVRIKMNELKCKRQCCTHQSPLAPHAGANYIQGGYADVPCTARLCDTIPGVIIHVSLTCRTNAGSGRPPLNGLTFQPAIGQQTEVVLILLLVQRCGTVCQAMWHQLCRWGCSRTGSRCTCSAAATKLFDSESHFLFPVISSRPVKWFLQ